LETVLCAIKQLAKERILSIMKLSTVLARPKSATLTTGGSSFVRSTFCGIEQESESGAGGTNSAGTMYLGLEIAVGDALFVDILQKSM
jgi:hypothetical protein